MRSVEEAEAYMSALRQMLLYLEVSDCKMEQGRLRFEASVSLRPFGAEKYGTRVEVKNLNSMKSVRDSLRSEIARQTKVLDAGEIVHQQTMLWDEASGTTQPMRSKEQAHDYRYFPEPDLQPLVVSAEFIEQVRREMPELPDAMRDRFMREYDVSFADASQLVSDKDLAQFYETTAKSSGNPRVSANFILSELQRELNNSGKTAGESPVTPENLAELIKTLDAGKINNNQAKEVLIEMFTSGKTAEEVIREKGFEQISDAAAIEKIVDEIIAANQNQVAAYRGGNEKLFGFFVGQTMKASGGKANPKIVNEILKAKLSAV
jgi:aspartyl-tRNA(Asn)/glutamyl-tRNA(Gln) amidotransferase subunit B